MKTLYIILVVNVLTFGMLQAQTEISGYADADPTNGINDLTAVTYSIDEAVVYCRDLVEDGKDDWYLPSGEELMLFIPDQDECASSPGCVSSSSCEWTAGRYHWTRTQTGSGWLCIYTQCNVNNLVSTSYSVGALQYTRCVR